MKNIKIEELAPYLPYELFVYSLVHKRADLIIGMDKSHLGTHRVYLKTNEIVYYLDALRNIKPILRPMNLTTPIKIDGVEVVPIVELAKIAFPDYDNLDLEEEEGYCSFGIFDFAYEKSINAFACSEYTEPCDVPNQLSLFQWLFKNKFDVLNLIGQNLAVDVNTLETNPYE